MLFENSEYENLCTILSLSKCGTVFLKNSHRWWNILFQGDVLHIETKEKAALVVMPCYNNDVVRIPVTKKFQSYLIVFSICKIGTICTLGLYCFQILIQTY